MRFFRPRRRERAAEVSTSGNDALRSPAAARRSLSPRNWQQQQPSASGRKSAAATAAGSAAGAPRSSVAAGQKRRLSSAAAAAADPRSQIGERSGIGRQTLVPISLTCVTFHSWEVLQL